MEKNARTGLTARVTFDIYTDENIHLCHYQ